MMDDQGTVRVALPLARGPKSARALTAPYTTLYAPPLSDPKWAHALGARAREFVPDSLRLDSLDFSHDGIGAFLKGLHESGLPNASFAHFINRFEPVTDFDLYWKKRPGRLRSTIKRKLKSLSTSSLEFRCARDASELNAAVTQYRDVYAASWKEPEPHPQFIDTMVNQFAPSGKIRIATMSVSGTVIAAQIWLLSDQRATIFKLAHREDFKDLSPGSLLTHWMLKHTCREENIREVDFGRGDDDYKKDWLSDARLRSGVIIANPASRGGLETLCKQIWPTRISNAWKRMGARGS